MASRTKFQSKNISKEIKKVCKKTVEDKVKMKAVIKSAAVPVVQEILRKHTDEDVVNKPFVDSKGNKRYFVIMHNSEKPIFTEAGKYRLQNKSHRNMTELKYMQAEMKEMEENGNKWIFPVELYNNFPAGPSIYDTTIKNDGVLLSDWIIDGDIFMPPAESEIILSDDEWERYKNGQLGENRYKPRNFYVNALNEMMNDSTRSTICSNMEIEIIKLIRSQMKTK